MELTKEQLEKRVSDFFNGEEFKKRFEEVAVKHYEWEEDGVKYSAWKIGKNIMTGDGGMEIYRKAMQNASIWKK